MRKIQPGYFFELLLFTPICEPPGVTVIVHADGVDYNFEFYVNSAPN